MCACSIPRGLLIWFLTLFLMFLLLFEKVHFIFDLNHHLSMNIFT